MKKFPRRVFFKHFLSSIAGSTLLLNDIKRNLLENSQALAHISETFGDSEKYWEKIKEEFVLLPKLHYFNNATLGPSPKLVINATEQFIRTLESYPSKYITKWSYEKEQVRKKAAQLLGASTNEIALTHNTTEGMNIIASSLALKPGDEVILSNHEHPSGTIPWKYWQETKGIKLVRPTLPINPRTEGELIDVYKKAITSRTRVISICHIVNTNGMILPIKAIAEIAHDKNILVVVDGAQSAGMINFNLHDLGCDFYATSGHKWLFSPKGMGIFYAKKNSQRYIKPIIVAYGYKDKSIKRFENYSTRNMPELLGLGTAFDFQNFIGSQRREKRIYFLKKHFLNQIVENHSIKLKTPLSDNLSAGILTIEILGKDAKQINNKLLNDYKIVCRTRTMCKLNGLRVSFSIYNTKEDIDYLLFALDEICRG